MQTLETTIQSRIERYREALKEAGVKLTHQRLVIMEEIARAEDHPDADAVFQAVRARVPTISLYTVYRTLQMLGELKLIQVLSSGGDRMRFDPNERPHHHFVCRSCGSVLDFYNEGFNALAIPDAVRALGRIDTAQVEVRGMCRECLAKS